MKKDIHPTTQVAAFTCNSCNAKFSVISTLESFDVEVCSQCHPFYTGEQRIMDTAGRADKFSKRMAKAAELQAAGLGKKKKKAKKNDEEETAETEEETAVETPEATEAPVAEETTEAPAEGVVEETPAEETPSEEAEA